MDEEEVLSILAKDPGNSIFAEYADALRRDGGKETAILVCLRGLSINPSCNKGRLVLARSFFELGFRPFAMEQLVILQNKLPTNEVIKRLAGKFSLDAPQKDDSQADLNNQKVISEAEFDFNEIDLIEDK